MTRIGRCGEAFTFETEETPTVVGPHLLVLRGAASILSFDREEPMSGRFDRNVSLLTGRVLRGKDVFEARR